MSFQESRVKTPSPGFVGLTNGCVPAPCSGLGRDISPPLRKNAAVHHSKNCAMTSQMGHSRPKRSKQHDCLCPLCPESRQTDGGLAKSALCHNPTCPLPNRRDDSVTFHDGAAIGMGEIPDHYEDAVVIPSRGYPALWRRQVGEKSNVTPHAPIAP